MAPLVLVSILFLCALINSYFFSPMTKLLSWLHSLLLPHLFFLAKPISDHTEVVMTTTTKKKEKKKKVDGDLLGVFMTFDRDGDGFVTMEELEESLRRLGLFTSRQEVVSMMERVDANGDGLIDLEEFCKLYETMERSEEEREEQGASMDLMEAFDVFDGNRDGLITVEELMLVLSSLGLSRRAEDCRDMIEKVDLDGDGMVNFEEFKKMMVIDKNSKAKVF